MNILYILGAYKPRASANGVCSDNIIKELVKQGHSVTVISNYAAELPRVLTDENDVTVYRVKQRFSQRLADWAQYNKSSKPNAARLANVVGGVLNKLKLIITAPFWPKVSVGVINRFSKTAVKLCRNRKFDYVITAYTPVEALLAGCAVKKAFPEIKYIPYFLDSLSGGYGPKVFSKETVIKRGLKIEEKVFDIADKIVLMESSREHHEKYNKKYLSKAVFLDIPMLYKNFSDEDIKSSENDNSGKIKMLFVGSIAAGIRNPEPLISALQKVENKNIECEFVGNINCMSLFEPLKSELGERLVFTGFLPHEQLFEKIANADVLINIGNLVSTMVPSKIFEYMSYGKPIISTFEIENEPSAGYLKNYPLALLLNGNDGADKNGRKIDEFLNEQLGKTVPFENVEQDFYKNTPNAFVKNVIMQ